jgi:DNA processing protein
MVFCAVCLNHVQEIIMGDHKKYWVGFNRISGIGPARMRRLIDEFGGIEAAWKTTKAGYLGIGLHRKLVEDILTTQRQIDLDAEMNKLAALGIEVLTWEDIQYPGRLFELDTSPPVLYVWGRIESVDRYSVAIVGTRRKSPYGETVAREISLGLAANGITIVSGLARGIDGIAHRGALESGGRTLAVLGSGIDRIYPPEHRKLAEQISGRGAIISEYGLGTAPEARNFPPRNRIISGLSMAVIVVEAGQSSGALITAHFAAEQGREVFAVPGSVHSKVSRGTNRLIRNGAIPFLSLNDVLEVLNLELIARQESVEDYLPEDEVERMIYEKLSADPVHVDDIQAECGLPVSKITASLAMLELKGQARQVGGMNFVRVREPLRAYRVE